MPSSTQRQRQPTPAGSGNPERKQTAHGEDLQRQGAIGDNPQPNSRGRLKAKDFAGLEVEILGRPFRVNCAEEEKQGLLKAVEYLDAKMREIRASGNVIGNERIAIMAALNIAHEYLSTRISPGFDIGEFRRRIKSMSADIDAAMLAQNDLFE